MPRPLFPALLLSLLLACGPDTAERGEFSSSRPFPSPLAPVTVAGDAPSEAASASSSGSATGPDAGATGPDAGSPPALNQAERVWKAQADVWRTGQRLKEDFGTPAVKWLKLARSLGGASATAGLLTEQADGTYRYVTGGTTLRMAARSGWRGELRVDTIVGDLGHQDFPRDREGVDATWLFANGTALRCVLEREVSRFLGAGADDAGAPIRVAVTYRASKSVVTGPDASGNWATVSSADIVASGEVTWPGERTVRYVTKEFFGLCVGECTGGAGTWSFREHQTTVEFVDDGRRWSLTFEDGYDRSTETGISAQLWRGTITGPANGRLVVRPFNGIFTLDVELGADRYTAGVATHLLE